MRKLLILGILICVFLAINHQIQFHQNLNDIKLTEALTDAALYLSLAASYPLSKNKLIQLLAFSCMIPVDIMAYLDITQGYLIYLSYAISYLLAGITVLALFSQYKMTIFSFIIMAHYQLFMAIAYYLAAGLGIDEVAKSFMFVNYKAILYGIHLLIIGSITEWTIIDRIRINIDYYIRVFRIRLGVYFVGRTF